MGDSVKVSITLDLHDYRQHLFEERYDNLPNTIGLYGWYVINGILILLILITVCFSIIELDTFHLYSTSFLVGIMLFLYFICINPIKIALYAKRVVKNDILFQKELDYELSDNGLIVNCEANHIENNWEDIYVIKEFKSSFGIFTSSSTRFILPKRFFKDNSEIDLLKEIMKRNIEKKKLKLKKQK